MKKTSMVWPQDLLRLLGTSRVSLKPGVLSAHAGDAWFASALPDAVVFPRKTEEVVRVMKFAKARKIPVTARGAGRGYVGGCVPKRGGIVISFVKMNRLLELRPEDGLAVVQPGMITGELQAAARKIGWFYPPDPASLKECSIGGNVATNAGGPRCLKYGVTRHYILGLEVVLADGTVVRVGGRTHKNKAGFDLIGMFVGSEGMLGLVTEITCRLIPHPPARATISAGFASMDAAAAVVGKVFAAGFLPCALEVTDAFTLEAARKHLGAGLVPEGQAHVLLEVDGQARSVRSEITALGTLMTAAGAVSVRMAKTDAACEKLWDLRRGFSMSLKATGLTKFNEDVTVPRGRVVDLFKFGSVLQKKYGIQVACFGHAGDGNIHVNLMADLKQEGMQALVDQALDALFRQVIAWKGSITGEHGIGLAKMPWWPEATPRELHRLHLSIKKALDPDGLLNPAKFLG